jgi:toxin-antitoxin system PIN domain toxin
MISIPDVNVLVYAVDEQSPFHRPSNEWLTGALNGQSPVGFTWHALAGFVRIVTNPKITPKPRSVVEAFDSIESWLAQTPSRVIHPAATHLATFRRLVEAAGAAGNRTTDANLAAIALGHDGEVVSCDSDFGKFPGLKRFNPVTGVRVGR